MRPPANASQPRHVASCQPIGLRQIVNHHPCRRFLRGSREASGGATLNSGGSRARRKRARGSNARPSRTRDTVSQRPMKDRLRRGALWTEIDQAGEQHAGVEEDAHGQRFRSSSMSAANRPRPGVTRGLSGGQPAADRLSPAAGRPRYVPGGCPRSSTVIWSSVPGVKPARSLTAAGMTTRPALSMVVLMASVLPLLREMPNSWAF